MKEGSNPLALVEGTWGDSGGWEEEEEEKEEEVTCLVMW